MKVLVTGGAGFIGGNLVRKLLHAAEVTAVAVIDDLSTGYVSNLDGLDVEFHEASILDFDALRSAAAGADAIVHLAALGSVPRSVAAPMPSHHANATGTLQVLEVARMNNNAHVVLASSSSVYGANPTLPKVESLMCEPMSPYAVSKLATEQYALSFARCYDLPVLPFRFFNVYGPLQPAGHAYAAVVPVFLDAALRGEPLPVDGDGLQSRDFTFVGTVTELLCRAVVERVVGPPTNLAFGTRTTLLDLIGMIEDLLGHTVEKEWRPTRPGDVRDSRADNSRLRGLFGDIEAVPLEVGLHETLRWMQSISRGANQVHPGSLPDLITRGAQ